MYWVCKTSRSTIQIVRVPKNDLRDPQLDLSHTYLRFGRRNMSIKRENDMFVA